jgi:AbrB family looped-hinge helix DNA binding protein
MRITTKGQVTIPIEIREKLGLLPHTEVRFEIDGNAVRLVKGKPTGTDRGHRLIDHFRTAPKITKMTTAEIMALTRGEE